LDKGYDDLAGIFFSDFSNRNSLLGSDVVDGCALAKVIVWG